MMNIYEHKTTFGWEGDEGIGEVLIQQILNGSKWATCAPKSLYEPDELAETYDAVGEWVTVYDKFGSPRCNIIMNEVFETTFGNPDPRLVEGEGDGTDTGKFQDDHRKAWANLIENGFVLDGDTILIVEFFELAEKDGKDE